MNVLVIGSGGREHALCRTLARTASGPRPRVFCAPGNAGIAEDAECVAIGATDVSALADFAERKRVELTIPGGESSLAAGLADEFERRRLAVAGPTRAAARLESSKAFAKDFMLRHGIPTARYRVAESAAEALGILRGGEFGAADKAVVVTRGRAEAEAAVVEMMEGGRVGSEAAGRVVIEEALAGREASLLLWTDGRGYKLMPPARDHKRVGEGDAGPNTGGMGAVTSPDVLDEETLARCVREIVEPTLEGARADGLDFRGVLFVGLMLTGEGPRVLEYNVRFGDPETQAILVRLRSDLHSIFDSVARGGLGSLEVEWSEEASACVVLAARGYPERPETGARIEGLEEAGGVPEVRVFHAGTARAPDGSLVTAGGRVLGVTAAGQMLDAALARCYESASRINWDGLHYRRDIGRFR